MALSKPTTSGGAGGAAGLTDTLIISVTTGGSDASNINRPDTLSGGDYSAFPFLTPAAAVASIAKILNGYNVFLRCGAGTFAGFKPTGFLGGGMSAGVKTGLHVVCSSAAVTPTTGVASGTAGAGTNATTVIKPTGENDWTASDPNIVGKMLKITGGAGAGSDPVNFPVLRKIYANTTTSLSVASISGMDNTTEFEIVSVATFFSEASGEGACIVPSLNSAPIRIVSAGFSNAGALNSLVQSALNSSLELCGCDLSLATDAESFLSDKDGDVLLDNCKVSAASDVLVKNNNTFVEFRDLYCNGGSLVEIRDSLNALVSMRSTGALSHALKLVDVNRARGEVVANGGAATAVYLEGTEFTAIGANLLTGSGNTGYGLQIEGGKKVSVAGSSITGTTGDILYKGVLNRWSVEGNNPYGLIGSYEGAAILSAIEGMIIKYGGHLFIDEVKFSSRIQGYGYFNQAFGTETINLTNGTPYDMTTGGRLAGAVFNCTSALGVAILPSGATLGGCEVTCPNIGDQTMTFQAPGSGTIYGSATLAAGSVAKFLSLFSTSGTDFIRVL